MKTEIPQLMRRFFNEGLLQLDKKMKVFLENKTAKGKSIRTKIVVGLGWVTMKK